jgi:peroxiredoxin
VELPADWDLIPGARGCTTEARGFRDRYAEFADLDVRIFGVSTDDPAYQEECVDRLGLRFPLVSDAGLELAGAWRLPVFEAEGRVYLKRLTLLLRDGVVERVWYPIFPPDRHPGRGVRRDRRVRATARTWFRLPGRPRRSASYTKYL